MMATSSTITTARGPLGASPKKIALSMRPERLSSVTSSQLFRLTERSLSR